MANQTVLVTGANGFLGRAVCTHFLSRGDTVRAMVRDARSAPAGTHPVVADLGGSDAAAAVAGSDVVIHLAARVHHRGENGADFENAYNRVNATATRELAEAAERAGVARFVFASSVKAVADRSVHPLTDADAPQPTDAYGRSKLAAEHALDEIGRRGSLRISTLRLPLVYGPGVKANMLSLFRLVDRGWPIPLGAARTPRSMLFVGNFLAAVDAVIASDLSGSETFFVSDDQDVSVSELIRTIGESLGRPVRLVPVPESAFRAAATLTHALRPILRLDLGPVVDRLFSPLQVNPRRLRERAGYRPRFTVQQGIAETARWYSEARVSLL